MTRIKITDLPLLADLSEEQLKELFGAGPRSYRPTFDALEDRQLMSGVSLVQTSTIATFGKSTSAAVYLSQPAQVILTAPSTPAASNAILNQNLTITTDVQPKGPDYAALFQIQPIDDTVDYGVGIQPTTPLTPTNAPSTGTMGIQTTHAKLNPSDIDTGLNAIAARAGQLVQQGYLGGNFIPKGQENKTVRNTGVLYADNDLGLVEFFADPKGPGVKMIAWSPNTGANLVEGLIFQEYGRVGGTGWGFPTVTVHGPNDEA